MLEHLNGTNLKPTRVMSEADQKYIRIPLTKGHYCLIDKEDLAEIGKYQWCYSGGRAIRNSLGEGISKNMMMHRQIMKAPEGIEVDHIDGNPLNNSRSNLRLATQLQNNWNKAPRKDSSTGSKSVFYTPRVNKGKPWCCYFKFRGEHIYVGVFHTKEEAELAYETKAKELHGDFFRNKEEPIPDWSYIPMASRSVRSNQTKTGFRGVYPYLTNFKAVVRHEKKNIYLGLFPTAALASAAVEAKIKELRPCSSSFAT